MSSDKKATYDKDEVDAFLREILPSFSGGLDRLQTASVSENVPVIPHETAKFIYMLLKMKRPTKILEIGTAVGFSAALFCEALSNQCSIISIERFDVMYEQAIKNITELGLKEYITIIKADAKDALPNLQQKGEKFDFIFLDAAKAQYLSYLPYILTMLNKGGLFICDDVLQDGELVKNRYKIPRRQRTIHKRMRTFLWELTNNNELVTSVIPIGGGLTVSYKEG